MVTQFIPDEQRPCTHIFLLSVVQTSKLMCPARKALSFPSRPRRSSKRPSPINEATFCLLPGHKSSTPFRGGRQNYVEERAAASLALCQSWLSQIPRKMLLHMKQENANHRQSALLPIHMFKQDCFPALADGFHTMRSFPWLRLWLLLSPHYDEPVSTYLTQMCRPRRAGKEQQQNMI